MHDYSRYDWIEEAYPPSVFFFTGTYRKKSDFFTVRDSEKKVHTVKNENVRYVIGKIAPDLSLRTVDFRSESG